MTDDDSRVHLATKVVGFSSKGSLFPSHVDDSKTTDNDSVTVYAVEVTFKGFIYMVPRRYSSFEDFHKSLKAEAYAPLPPLPPKQQLGRFTPGFITERQKALDDYLQKLVAVRPPPPPSHSDIL